MGADPSENVDWHAILRDTDHRPWPVPDRPWVGTMTWLDAMLAHWPIAPELLEPTIPDRLTLDTRDGYAWLTVLPFEMANTTARGLTRLPWKLRFAELNLRTYVTVDGRKPGIWFYSMDATSRLTVLGARSLLNLPYFLADIDIERGAADGAVDYESRRIHLGAPTAEFGVRYRPTGEPSPATDDPVDTWLAERYCLYTQISGMVHRLEVHHRPWPLRDAHATFRTNTLAEAALDIDLDTPAERLHVADRLDVLAWPPTPVTG